MQRMQRGSGTTITYVRQTDRPDVYAVEQSLRSMTDRSVDDWRDKNVWTLSRSEIQQIDFAFPGDSSFTIRRAAQQDTSAGTDESTWVSAGDTLATREVSSVLRTVSSLEADGFVDGASPEDFGDALYTIRIQLQDGPERVLRLRPDPDGEYYNAAVTGYPYVIQVSQGTWDRSVLAGRSALLKNQ